MRSDPKLQRFMALVFFMALGLPAHSHAPDSVSLEVADGNETQILRFGAQWRWDKTWWQSNGTHLGGYWDVNLAQWREQNYQGRVDEHQTLSSVGITPVFRWQSDSQTGLYAEAGIGLHLLSDTYDNNGHILTGTLQFGDHVGIGYVFNNKVDVSLKRQHFSNCDMKKPNNGINLIVLKISYRF